MFNPMRTNNRRLKAALQAVNLERLFQDFADESIADDILDQLTEIDLEKLGVIKLGDRKRLISIFKKMYEKRSPNTSMVEVHGGTLPEDSEFKGLNVKGFLIGRHPVMQEEWEWERVWSLSNSYEIGVGKADGSFSPVSHVTWYDAVKWCNAKSEHEGFTPPYECDSTIYRKGTFGPSGSKMITLNSHADGYRLPLEAEWVWAARGGLAGQSLFSNIPENLAAPKLEDASQDAGSLEQIYNELGIFNMSTNIWEWCWDLDDTQTAHRIRSAIWSDDDKSHKIEPRISRSPDSHLSVLGFRLARNL